MRNTSRLQALVRREFFFFKDDLGEMHNTFPVKRECWIFGVTEDKGSAWPQSWKYAEVMNFYFLHASEFSLPGKS